MLTITAGHEEARKACSDARKYGFRAVVAFPWNLGVLVDELTGSSVRAQIPVGFPSGCVTTKTKCAEAEEGLERGATDADMVMNVGAFKSRNYELVSADIAAVSAVVRAYGAPFKVIIEIGALSDEEIVTASKLVQDSGADFIKTCTGFAPGRATNHAIELIRETVGPELGIKASGGVALMRSGATVVAFRGHLVEQLERIGWKQ